MSMKISPRKHRKACYTSRLRFSLLFCKFDTMASPIFASAILCISSRYHHHQRSQCWSGYKETASLTDMPEHKYENNVTGPVRSGLDGRMDGRTPHDTQMGRPQNQSGPNQSNSTKSSMLQKLPKVRFKASKHAMGSSPSPDNHILDNEHAQREQQQHFEGCHIAPGLEVLGRLSKCWSNCS